MSGRWTRYARGGAIPSQGDAPGVRMVSVGQCARGHTLWSIEGEAPCHLISAADLRTEDGQALLDCPNVPVSGLVCTACGDQLGGCPECCPNCNT